MTFSKLLLVAVSYCAAQQITIGKSETCTLLTCTKKLNDFNSLEIKTELGTHPKCMVLATAAQSSKFPEVEAFMEASKNKDADAILAALKAIKDSEYVKACDYYRTHIQPCILEVALPMLLDHISKSGPCCNNFEPQFDEKYSFHITNLITEMLDIFDTLVCDERGSGETCGFTLVQGSIGTSAVETGTNFMPLIQIPSAATQVQELGLLGLELVTLLRV